MIKSCLLRLLLLCACAFGHRMAVHAQEDTVPRADVDTARKGLTVDEFLRNRKGWIGGLAKGLLADTSVAPAPPRLQRNDLPFQKYDGLFIRRIVIRSLDFGISIGDTTKALNNKITKLVNDLHLNTVEQTIRNNVFFKAGSAISPFLLGVNERHLRDLPYINDARILVQRLRQFPDSADIYILTKDVYSLGGGVDMSRINRVEVRVQEDNFLGRGDRLQLQTLVDTERKKRFGLGTEIIKRNIAGSFIDAYAGHRTFNRSFTTGAAEETITYFRLIKPLVHPFMKWTYALDASLNETTNMYSNDSVYNQDARYSFNSFDAWVGWNFSADKLTEKNDENRLNWLLGMRMLKKDFSTRPGNYSGRRFYRYSDFSAILGAVSLFRQNFYKTQYIYGFGRNEDVPEGVDVSVTAGWTKKEERERPYLAVDYQRYFFSPRENYVNLVLRAGSFFYKKKFEDVALLAGLDYFSRLRTLSPKWKQRTFVNASIGRQMSYRLNDPLILESKYGLEGFRNDDLEGNLRVSLKGESVFFSPWAPLLFKLAPFVFGSASLFRQAADESTKGRLFTAVGGGIRTRNESLIFGTIEVKGIYYGIPNFFGERYRIEFNTNVRFRYNQQFIKRPELVQLN